MFLFIYLRATMEPVLEFSLPYKVSLLKSYVLHHWRQKDIRNILFIFNLPQLLYNLSAINLSNI